MALAIHIGGPADGAEVPVDQAGQVRYYATKAARENRDGYVSLARYVFFPPRDRARCTYRYTGVEQKHGPRPGMEDAPDWSVD